MLRRRVGPFPSPPTTTFSATSSVTMRARRAATGKFGITAIWRWRKEAQAALAMGGSVNWDDGADPNSRLVPNTGSYTFTSDMAFTPTKGDLIAMGDFNSDGSFDGKDLYLMAHGAALADTNASTTLSGGADAFADKVASGVLRKNAARWTVCNRQLACELQRRHAGQPRGDAACVRVGKRCERSEG